MNIWEIYAKIGKHRLPSTGTVLVRDKSGILYDIVAIKEEADTLIIDVAFHDQSDTGTDQ
jgi:hypothetical protein